MQSDLLHVVTAIANPLRWRSRIKLYLDFERHMLESGVRLTTVECAYGDRPFELADSPGVTSGAVRHVGVRAHTIVWSKENLLNLGITRLPQDWKYVAWIDADIRFRRPDWAAETVHALQLHDIVQPWSDCYDLGPNDEHIEAHTAFCRLWRDRRPVGPGPYTFAHPGYAWAATRQALEHLGGLIETAALGAADHHMALALAGLVHLSVPGGISPGYVEPLRQREDRAVRHIAGDLGCIAGTIEHAWHGSKAARSYVERWGILIRHAFDPVADLKRNVWGVLELAGNKPGLRRDIEHYMRTRNEDTTTFDG